MLKIHNVSKIYSADGSVGIGLHRVSAEFSLGEIVAIVGESGSGKSTFLNVVSGMDSFEEGEVYFGDQPLSAMSKSELENYRKQNIGFVFQNYNLIDSYTVLQNVLLSLELRGITGKDAKDKAKEILRRVGLEGRIHHKGTKLSGGEKQRVVIARALASDAPIIACDEPTGNLDSNTGAEIIALLKEISQDKLILIVTHNYDEIAGIATRKIKFHDGNIVEDSTLKPTSVVSFEETKFDESKPLTQKNYFTIALRNVLSTPKKSIFTFIVFSVIVYLLFFFYMVAFDQKNSFAANKSPYYQNVSPARTLGYHYKGETLDLNKIKEKMPNETFVVQSFVEEKVFGYLYSKKDDTNYSVTLLTHYDPSYTLAGRLPKEDNELVLGVTERIFYLEKEKIIGRTMILHTTFDGSKEYKVTGMFISDANYTNSGVYGNENFTKYIEKNLIDYNSYLLLGVREKMFAVQEQLSYLKIDNSLEPKEIRINSTDPILSGVIPYLQQNVAFEINTHSFQLPDYRITLNNTSNDSITISQETYDELVNMTSSISYYSTNRIKREKFMDIMDSLGYNALNPCKYSGFDDYNEFVVTTLVTFLGVTAAIIVLYFFSYLILTRIFSSKNKDYIIMRTLGINKKGLNRVVLMETEMIALAASFFVLILYGISRISTSKIFFGHSSMTFIPSLIIIIAIVIFGLLLSLKFKKRFYKFSIQTSLRKERANRD